MDEILQQLGELIVGSVPTILLFFVLVVAYEYLIHKPLMRMLEERRSRTTGAIERAQDAINEADAKTLEYESSLRAARGEILRAREQRIQQWNNERDKALEDIRLQAHTRTQAARAQLETEVAAARKTIEGSVEQLAGQILKAVLVADVAPAESTR
ncbi:MAG TPA: ATP synthase F0 subunit B [Acidisarcina sp.]|nr:ATP synthase F0 subunit B [Acidisarcina sp.]